MWSIVDVFTALAAAWWLYHSSLKRHNPVSLFQPGDPGYLPSLRLNAALFGLFLAGLLHAWRLILQALPNTLELMPIWLVAFVFAIATTVFAWSITALRMQPRRAEYAMRIGPASLMAGLLFGFVFARDLNIDADLAPAQQVPSVLVEKHISRSRGHPRILRVAGWDDGHLVDVEVGRALYSRFKQGEAVTVMLHSGALGARWIGNIEHAKK